MYFIYILLVAFISRNINHSEFSGIVHFIFVHLVTEYLSMCWNLQWFSGYVAYLWFPWWYRRLWLFLWCVVSWSGFSWYIVVVVIFVIWCYQNYSGFRSWVTHQKAIQIRLKGSFGSNQQMLDLFRKEEKLQQRKPRQEQWSKCWLTEELLKR